MADDGSSGLTWGGTPVNDPTKQQAPAPALTWGGTPVAPAGGQPAPIAPALTWGGTPVDPNASPPVDLLHDPLVRTGGYIDNKPTLLDRPIDAAQQLFGAKPGDVQKAITKAFAGGMASTIEGGAEAARLALKNSPFEAAAPGATGVWSDLIKQQADQAAAGFQKTAQTAPNPQTTGLLTSAAGALGGAAPFVAGGEAAPLFMGAGGIDQVRQDAQAKGVAGSQKADDAEIANGLLQMQLGKIPLGELLDRIPPQIKSTVIDYLARVGIHAAGGAALGTAMQTGTNVVEKATIDPNKNLTEGVGENAATMAAFMAAHALIPRGGLTWGGKPVVQQQPDDTAPGATPPPGTPATTWGGKPLSPMPETNAGEDYFNSVGPGLHPNVQQASAIITRLEGGLNTDGSPRTSPAGAIGQYQVMPETARKYLPGGASMSEDQIRAQLRDPNVNAAVGQHLISDLLHQYGGDMSAVAIAYNAGPKRANEYEVQGPGTALQAVVGPRGGVTYSRVPAPKDESFLPMETQKYLANMRRHSGEPLPSGGAVAPEAGIVAPPGTPVAGEAPQEPQENGAPAAAPPPAEPLNPALVEAEAASKAAQQPVAPDALEQARKDVALDASAPPRGETIYQAIRRLGGMPNRDSNGKSEDFADFVDSRAQPGMINNKAGLSVDGMRQALQDEGWFGAQPDDGTTTERPGDSINDLTELMRRQRAGQSVFHPDSTTAADYAGRAALRQEMTQAGIAADDPPDVKATKLAQFREERSAEDGSMIALRARADDLGVPHDAASSYPELLGDVIVREAIQNEGRENWDGWEPTADHAEGLIHDQLSPAERQLLLEHGLSAEDHEWLSHPDRGPVGEQEVPGGAQGAGEGPARAGGAEGRAEGASEGSTGGGGNEAEGVGTERVRLANGEADQSLIPGTERSAKQAAAAREGALKPTARQEEPGGLFAPPEAHEPSLFDVPRKGEPEAPQFQRRETDLVALTAEARRLRAERNAAPSEAAWEAAHAQLVKIAHRLERETGSPLGLDNPEVAARFGSTEDFKPEEPLIRAAVKEFGITSNPMAAGYVLPDGRMLDFSEEGGGGGRTEDHRAVERLDGINGSRADAMVDFMNRTGAIRVDFSSGMFETQRPPTDKQIRTAVRAAREADRPLMLEASRPDGSPRASFELERPTAEAVKRFFDENRAGEAPSFQRAPFYSALERHVGNLSLKSATPDQWKATIDNATGVKKEEVEWTGVKDWLDLFAGQKVDKAAVQAFLRDNGVQVDERVLGGEEALDPAETREQIGKRVDEITQDHPDWTDPQIFRAARAQIVPAAQYADWVEPFSPVDSYRELLLTLPKVANPPSTHWDTDGVMAHVRLDMRTDSAGKKTLFVHEIQSDWHQKGRDQGYQASADIAKAEKAEEDAREANFVAHVREAQLVGAVQNFIAGYDGAPDDPVTKALEAPIEPHHVMSTRKALLDPWSTPYSDEQRRLAAARVVAALPADHELQSFAARDRAAQLARVETRSAANNLHAGLADAPFKSSWPALVMKRVIKWAVDHGAEKVAWTTGDQQVERYGLNTDQGDGMRAFYDRNLVNVTNDLIKRYGTKVGKGDIAIHEPTAEAFRQGQRATPEGLQYAREAGQLAEVHAFDVTPKMRDAATEGLPLFQRAEHPAEATGEPMEELGSGLRGTPIERGPLNDEHVTTVEKILRRLAPSADVRHMQHIDAGEGHGAISGATYGVKDGDQWRHVIAWAADTGDSTLTPRHEAIHALRRLGLFQPGEWNTLKSAAIREGWLEKYRIAERYPDLNREQQLEEGIAEAFSHQMRDMAPEPSRDGLVTPPTFREKLDPIVRATFDRMGQIVSQVADMVKRVFGAQASAKDVFSRVESGEVGKRTEATPQTAYRDPQHARSVGPVEERDDAERTRATGKPVGFVNRVLGQGADEVGTKFYNFVARKMPSPLTSIRDNLRMKANPMSLGSDRAQAEGKVFANTLRAIGFGWNRVDGWLEKNFTPEQRRQMWEALDEHGVLLRRGVEPGPDEGLNRLTDIERDAVIELNRREQKVWERAKALEMTDADGLEFHAPRMIVRLSKTGGPEIISAGSNAGKEGTNLITTTGQMKQRKHETVEETEAAARAKFGENVHVVRDIRTVALAAHRLEQAVAGRTLINKIKEFSDGVGVSTVEEDQAGNPEFFTIPGHPALMKWGPKMITNEETGKVEPAIDQNGHEMFDSKNLYIAKEFEGPLKAVLSTPNGPIYKAYMNLKGKTMSMIMYSPLMHNAVIYGKAIPVMVDKNPLTTIANLFAGQMYRDGYNAKTDPATMDEAIKAGVDPIGKRYGVQLLTGIAEAPNIVPGRSWTAQLLSKIPGFFNPEAGEATKRAIDKFGDLWHNTFLWDRVADLQMGIYKSVRDREIANGMDPASAQMLAAHFANRYAGALPMEAMSKGARAAANILLFSRSFTFTNVGAFKDAITGLPSDLQAIIARDLPPAALAQVQGEARAKAASMIVIDVALSYLGLVLAAGVTSVLTGQQFQGPWENEPGKEKRFRIGTAADDSALYGRLSSGKVAEDMQNWTTQPVSTLMAKLSPEARFVKEVITNDQGFGHKLWDPYDKTPATFVRNAGKVIGAYFESHFPEGEGEAIAGLFDPGAVKMGAIPRALLPLAGITVSKGAPGGPKMGIVDQVLDEGKYQLDQAKPGITADIRDGNIDKAKQTMTSLGVDPHLQGYIVKRTNNPNAPMSKRERMDFERLATPQQKIAFLGAQASEQAAASP